MSCFSTATLWHDGSIRTKRATVLFSSFRRFPQNRGNGSAVFEGSPIRYNITFFQPFSTGGGGGRVVRWCWVNFQCQSVLQFGLQLGKGLLHLQ